MTYAFGRLTWNLMHLFCMKCVYDVHSNIPDLPYFLLFSFRNAPKNHIASYTLVVLYINK